MGRQFQTGQVAVFADHKPGGAPVQGVSLLAYKKRAAGRLHPRALGGPCLDKPEFLRVQGMRRGESFFRRATCRTRSSTSTRESSNEQASETRRPWRNIKKSRQRSRAECRPPLAALRSFSTSRVVKCFRSPFSKTVPFRLFVQLCIFFREKLKLLDEFF